MLPESSTHRLIDRFALVLGAVVQARRQELAWTQEELADALRKAGVAVTQSHISKLEAGQRANPSTKLVIALATTLGISLDEVMNKAASSDEGQAVGTPQPEQS